MHECRYTGSTITTLFILPLSYVIKKTLCTTATVRRAILFAALFCLLPFVSSPIALILGFSLASLGLVPTQFNIAAATKKLLSYSIIGLGFGIHLNEAIEANKQGLGLIVCSIFFTLILGWVVTRLMGLDKKTGHLIASGTAICGGSAIAAVAPAINAKDDEISLALATVFVLNAIALFIFPVIGHLLDMSQHAFGTWAAIAIHDTSVLRGLMVMKHLKRLRP